MPRLVTQKELARTLNVTDRRIRQMEDEFILPPAGLDGRYDAELCAQRYAIFRSDRADGVERILAEIEYDAATVDLLVNDEARAPRTREEIQEASRKVLALFSALRFALVCMHRKDDFPRQAMLQTFQSLENDCLRALMPRAIQLIADEVGVSFEEASAQLAAQCAAEPAAAEA